MNQDYNIQSDSVQRLKDLALDLISNMSNLNSAYHRIIDYSHSNAMPIQMYETMVNQNAVRISGLIAGLINQIEAENLSWINKLIEGYENAMSIAGIASPVVTISSQNNSTDNSNSAPITSKAQQFIDGTRKVKELAERNIARAKKMADDQSQNERDMHKDFLAAFFNQQKSR